MGYSKSTVKAQALDGKAVCRGQAICIAYKAEQLPKLLKADNKEILKQVQYDIKRRLIRTLV
ncbi:MAG: hypothetical protein LBJ74_00110 [Heliobacteriaceae bacterium]|jgi:hypothetical protein|nr:hypothetical protein [Heliobacteriaceae bacterium]